MTVDGNGRELGLKELTDIRITVPWPKRISAFYRYPISNAFLCIYGLMRRDALIKVLSCARRGPLLTGNELPRLSRFAAIGEVASLPLILRKYRYHEGSSFHAEKATLSSSAIRGSLARQYNYIWHRLDQLFVLTQSSYPWRFKVYVGYRVLCFYVTHYKRRLIRFVCRAREKRTDSNYIKNGNK